MVGQLGCKAALYGERFIEELLVEVFLLLLHKHTCNTTIIKPRPTRSSNHLEQISEWEVHVSLELRVKELSPLDDDQSGGEIDSPGEGRSRHENLDLLFDEQVFHDFSVAFFQTGVMHAYAILDCLSQVFVPDVFRQGRNLFRIHVKERFFEVRPLTSCCFFLLISGTHGNQIECGESGLATGGDENEDGVVSRMGVDCFEGWAVHGGHAGAVCLFGEAIEENLDGDGADTGLEIEQAKFVDSHPVSHVFSVGEGRGQADKPDRALGLLCDVAHATDDDFDDGTAILTEQVDFIDYHKGNV